MRYRSRLEIISLVLRVASRGTSKTRLMYGAYLSYTQAKAYIDLLLRRGLIAYDEGTQLYTATDEGRRVLRAADEIERLIGPESEVHREAESHRGEDGTLVHGLQSKAKDGEVKRSR